jgi:hypothetical protein
LGEFLNLFISAEQVLKVYLLWQQFYQEFSGTASPSQGRLILITLQIRFTILELRFPSTEPEAILHHLKW